MIVNEEGAIRRKAEHHILETHVASILRCYILK